MSVQLIAFDLDGTTLNDDHHTISDANAAALCAAAESGVMIVPATGRALGRLPKTVKALPFRYAITANGASVYDIKEKKFIYQNTLSYETIVPIYKKLMELPIYIELYAEGECYTEPSREPYYGQLPFLKDRLDMIALSKIVISDLTVILQAQNKKIQKLNLPLIPKEYEKKIYELLNSMPGLEITSSFPGNAEINAPGCHKGAALEALCAHLQIPQSDVMAIGDNGNDVAMLKFAGIGVTPSNGADCAKEVAQELPCSFAEDAVAYAIKKWIHI